MIGRRAPIALIVIGLLVAAFVVDPRRREAAQSSAAVSAAALTPMATAVDAGTSTWFCAGGTVSVTGVAEQTVTVTNPTEERAGGTLQLFIEGQPPQSFPVEVQALDQQQIVLSTLAQGEWAAALVEMDHGGIIVTHDVLGVGGWDSDRCSSQASEQWYFPWGRTTPQEASSLRLALFNPFAVEAVVDITFDTEDGFRKPELLEGFLVPARRLVTVDLTEIVPVRERISTTIKTRSGRLIADRIQTLTGVDGTVALDVSAGAPNPATSWYFADGRADAETLERVSIYNPSDDTASVEVEVQQPRVTQELSIEPFELQIAAQSYAEIVVNQESRIALPIRHSTIVRSLNEVPIVAERVQLSGTVVASGLAVVDEQSTTTTTSAAGDTANPGAPIVALPPGLTATMGSPVVATRWVLPNAARPDVSAAKAVMANVSADQPVTVRVQAYAAGQPVTLPSIAAPFELDARQQVEIPLVEADPAVPAAPLVLVFESTAPIVVDGVSTYGPLPDVSVRGAIPLPDGVSVPDPLSPGGTTSASTASTARPASGATTSPNPATATSGTAATTVPVTQSSVVVTTVPVSDPHRGAQPARVHRACEPTAGLRLTSAVLGRIIIALLLAVAAAGIAAVINRRNRRAPVQGASWNVPLHLRRDDFLHPDAPWLVVLFSSGSCEVCRSVWERVQIVEHAEVAVHNVDAAEDRQLHARYKIDAVPLVVIVDRDGAVQKHFLGPLNAADLWGALAELRAD